MNYEKQKQSGGKDEQFRLLVLFVLRKALWVWITCSEPFGFLFMLRPDRWNRFLMCIRKFRCFCGDGFVPAMIDSFRFTVRHGSDVREVNVDPLLTLVFLSWRALVNHDFADECPQDLGFQLPYIRILACERHEPFHIDCSGLKLFNFGFELFQAFDSRFLFGVMAIWQNPELLICNFTKYIVLIQSFEQQVQLLVSLYQLTLFG